MSYKEYNKEELQRAVHRGDDIFHNPAFGPGKALHDFFLGAVVYLLDRSQMDGAFISVLARSRESFMQAGRVDEHWFQLMEPFFFLTHFGYSGPSSCAIGLAVEPANGRQIVVRTGGNNGDDIDDMEVVHRLREEELDLSRAGEQFIELIGSAPNE